MQFDDVFQGLRALVPLASAIGALAAIERDGDPVPYASRVLKGVAYASIAALPGHYVARYSPDTQPPAIVALTMIPTGNGEASLIWTTDKPSDSRAWWGLDPATLDHEAAAAPVVTHHHIELTGLLPDTTYWVRVGSADAIGNLALAPAPPSAPAPLATGAAPCAADDTPDAFAAGSPDAGVIVTVRTPSVTLRPGLAEEFHGPGLPAGWTAAARMAGGAAVVTSGGLAVDGASATDGDADLVDDDAIELEATLPGAGGAALGLAPPGVDAPACGFVVREGVLMAITDDGAGADTTAVPTPDSGDHRFTIERGGSSVRYEVDGVLVAEHARTVTGSLRAWVADDDADGAALMLARALGGPVASSGAFVSRVIDAGGPAAWRAPVATASIPDGAALALFVRAGPVPVPDASWTPWTLVNAGSVPAALAYPARCVQYRVTLTTTDAHRAPVLHAVTWSCTPPAPATTGVGNPTGALSWSRPSPNPSRGLVTFAVHLPNAGAVRLVIHGIDGRRVRTLARGWHAAGALDVRWDGADEAGHAVAAGLYFARLDTGGRTLRQTIVRLR